MLRFDALIHPTSGKGFSAKLDFRFTAFSEVGCLQGKEHLSSSRSTPLEAALRVDQGYDAHMAGPERVMGGRSLSRKGVIFCAFCASCDLAGFG
jgi:hypothetical protein